MEASTALDRAVDGSIDGPAVDKVLTAVLRVLVVPSKVDRLVRGPLLPYCSHGRSDDEQKYTAVRLNVVCYIGKGVC